MLLRSPFRRPRRARSLLMSAVVFACRSPISVPEPSLPEPRASAFSTPVVAPVSAARATTGIEPQAPSAPEPPAATPELGDVGHAFQEPLPARELGRNAPAIVVSNLSPGACSVELRRRKLPVERDSGAAAGVAVPMRITGAMHGVRFVTPSRKSVYGKLDCRLALALDGFAQVLQRHDVVAVRVDNLYRPRARLPGSHARSQHRYGLAIDVVSFQLASGDELSVERDWQGALGSLPCGPESRLTDATEPAIALRNIVCEVARSGLFHHILTPSFNAAHRDHLHLDIKRGDKRWIVE